MRRKPAWASFSAASLLLLLTLAVGGPAIAWKQMHETGTHDEPQIYRVEGIGHDFMVGTLDFDVIDEVREVSDRDSFLTARRLAREEGIFCGGSTGTVVFGAVRHERLEKPVAYFGRDAGTGV